MLPSLYKGAVAHGVSAFDMTTINSVSELTKAGVTADPTAQGVVALLALAVNVVTLAVIIKRAKAQHKNPYKNEIFAGTRDFEEAMERAA